jgi:hypothetical protein
MSAAEIVVRTDDVVRTTEKELWRAEAMKADNPRATYYGVNELPSDR